jgi:O6-methylguanine-DNA--protein-cysteine methyltransferase
VVASGGRLGGYTGGLDIKRTLMDIEGIEAGGAS